VNNVGLSTSPTELTAHRKSLDALTGIRFFAAFYVVMFHSQVSAVLLDHGYAPIGYFFQNGHLAVPLFFLLSGFILSYTYEGQIERPGGVRRFWEARFSRLWPLYFISLLLSSLPPLQATPAPGSAIASLLMLQAWNPFDVGMAGVWNAVCWTLSAEAFFYLCFPWTQRWLEKQKSRSHLAWVALMLFICILFNLSSHSVGTIAVGFYKHLPMPLIHLPEFFTGVGLGNYFLGHLTAQKEQTEIRLLPGSGIWTYASAIGTLALLCVAANRWTSLVDIGFVALIFGLAAEKTLLSRLLSTKTLLLGGGASYSIYLMQGPVKAWGNQIMAHLHQNSTGLRLALNAVLLLSFSLLLFKFVEEPTRRLLRSLFAKIERKRQGEAELRSVAS
jgi:peptidoglycan/LPS O-acetylase OafA/YrhL